MVGVLVGALVGPLVGSGEGVAAISVDCSGSGTALFDGKGGLDVSAAAIVSAVIMVWLVRLVSAFVSVTVVSIGSSVWLLNADVIPDRKSVV